jgi:hypothetical protein
MNVQCGDNCTSLRGDRKFVEKFRNGRTTFDDDDDDERFGRSSNIACIKVKYIVISMSGTTEKSALIKLRLK